MLGVAYSPDGALIATASADTQVMLWDTASFESVRTLSGHGQIVRAVAFSPDSLNLVSGSDDKTARIWDAKSGKQIMVLEDRTGAIRDVMYSPDGARVLLAGGDGAARMFLASVEGYQSFGCRVLRGSDLYKEVATYCDKYPDEKTSLPPLRTP